MSSVFFRGVVALLLALAVAAQGMAAVAAGQCMAFGHHGDAGTQPHEHDGHDAGANGHDHEAKQHSDAGKSSHCGPCTACCASASIAAPVALPLPPSPSNAKYFFLQLARPSVAPHRFDRPPLVG